MLAPRASRLIPRQVTRLGLLVLGLPVLGCQHRAGAAAGAAAGAVTSAGATVAGASSARPGPWKSLVQGSSLAGWHNFATPGQPVLGWEANNGIVTRTGEGGDLTTDAQYTNFELSLDWRAPAKGNSGVIYRIDPAANLSYESGPEMQILDDAGHPDGKSPLTSAGADYAIYPAPRGVVRPATEWNSARLIVNGRHVEHWLNGVVMVEYTLGSTDWVERVARSKFATAKGYGIAPRGFIALQDHGGRVAFRNIRIRELP